MLSLSESKYNRLKLVFFSNIIIYVLKTYKKLFLYRCLGYMGTILNYLFAQEQFSIKFPLFCVWFFLVHSWSAIMTDNLYSDLHVFTFCFCYQDSDPHCNHLSSFCIFIIKSILNQNKKEINDFAWPTKSVGW